MASDPNMQVLAGVGTLSPLPSNVKTGIMATGICGLLSFISCGLLFFYISYRLLTSRTTVNDTEHVFNSEQEDLAKLALGATWGQVTNDLRTVSTRDSYSQSASKLKRKRPDSNSFLTLIHNLLLADMLQALAFSFNLTWWRIDGIFVPSGLCGARK